ncbi:MAG: carbamoyltransferase HypF [Desulfovibrio sp.]
MTQVSRFIFTVTGQVQGVGFRPFVYRTALAHQLTGSVKNTPEGVIIAVQGPPETIQNFENDFHTTLPPLARIVTFESREETTVPDEEEFSIIKSTGGKGHSVLISPDVATCRDCLDDIGNPDNPRYMYPFTNCTNCGPRYTITHSIPYDRPVTSMGCFPMCEMCNTEYEDPMNRRFHAQPNACAECGPEVWLTDKEGNELARGPEALKLLSEKINDGHVTAVKGLGGFHLCCDATNEEAVSTLRKRKHRPFKPLAVMIPDPAMVFDGQPATNFLPKLVHTVSPEELEWMSGIHRPILLLEKSTDSALALSIAPDTNFVGVMYPYTPLHHILLHHMEAQKAPDAGTAALVMTSGNFSSEPISLGNREALQRLPKIADFFLLHNRDILIRTDDSVLRVNPVTKQPIFMRRARGFTPSPVFLPEEIAPEEKDFSVMGLGPELKCTMTITKGNQAFPGQHIGDMKNLETMEFHGEIRKHLAGILQVSPALVIYDLHPAYMTSQIGEELELAGMKTTRLQHHMAHIYAVLAENQFAGSALGIALDGTGYGDDGTIWGGEFLVVDNVHAQHSRQGAFMPLNLPGGEAAIKEPWRIAKGALIALAERFTMDDVIAQHQWPWTADAPSEQVAQERTAAEKMLPLLIEKNLNCPQTSSCGRLFDCVSALLGTGTTARYEGQAAIRLEAIQLRGEDESLTRYNCPVIFHEGLSKLDTHTLLKELVEEIITGVPSEQVARSFHLSLMQGIADFAVTLCKEHGLTTVSLSGGVMQNLTFATELPQLLEKHGLNVLMHTQVSPNDGCISLGQAAYGLAFLKNQ